MLTMPETDPDPTTLEERFKRVDERFDDVDRRLDESERLSDRRFVTVDKRFDKFEATMKAGFDHMDARFAATDGKFDAKFERLYLLIIKVGSGLIGTLIAAIAAILIGHNI